MILKYFLLRWAELRRLFNESSHMRQVSGD